MLDPPSKKKISTRVSARVCVCVRALILSRACVCVYILGKQQKSLCVASQVILVCLAAGNFSMETYYFSMYNILKRGILNINVFVGVYKLLQAPS